MDTVDLDYLGLEEHVLVFGSSMIHASMAVDPSHLCKKFIFDQDCCVSNKGISEATSMTPCRNCGYSSQVGSRNGISRGHVQFWGAPTGTRHQRFEASLLDHPTNRSFPGDVPGRRRVDFLIFPGVNSPRIRGMSHEVLFSPFQDLQDLETALTDALKKVLGDLCAVDPPDKDGSSGLWISVKTSRTLGK